MLKVLLQTCGGLGDMIQAVQCAHYVKEVGGVVDVLCYARDETFIPLKHLFGGKFSLIQHPLKERYGENYWALHNKDTIKLENPGYTDYYFHCPDLLFRDFPWYEYNVTPQVIRSTRLLTKGWWPENIIYVGTNTSTPEYFYDKTPELVRKLAEQLPDYVIYFNNITSWAGKTINNGDFSHLPSNVIYRENEDFNSSLGWLKKSCYLAVVDNGISHCAFQMGIPRTLLTKRLNFRGSAWLSRWYGETSDCLSYDFSVDDLVRTIEINIKIPETTLIPRGFVINNLNMDWPKFLMFKI